MTNDAIRTVIVLLAVAAAASAQTRAGGEFQVNTYITGRQADVRAAMEPDGDFVLVWTSEGQDGSLQRRIRPAVRGVGGAARRRVPGQQLHDQRSGFPRVAVGSRGDFVVVFGSSGRLEQRTSRPGASTPRATPSAPSSRSTPSRSGLPVPVPRRPGVRRPVRRELDKPERWQLLRDRRPPLRRSGNPIGDEFAGEHVHDRRPALRRHRRRRRRQLRRRLGGLPRQPRRRRLRHLRPALRRLGQPAGRRVPGEHLHHRSPVPPFGQRVPAGGFVVAWSSHRGRQHGECSPGASMPWAIRSGTTSSSTRRPSADQYALFGNIAHDARGNFVVTGRAGTGTATWPAPLPSVSALRAPAAAPSSGSTPTPRARRRADGRLRCGRQLRHRLGESLRPGRELLRSLRAALRRPGPPRSPSIPPATACSSPARRWTCGPPGATSTAPPRPSPAR